MFIVTRIWISISDLDLNSIIESHNENLKNLLNFIIIIKMANGMGSFAFFGFISRRTKLEDFGLIGLKGRSWEVRS